MLSAYRRNALVFAGLAHSAQQNKERRAPNTSLKVNYIEIDVYSIVHVVGQRATGGCYLCQVNFVKYFLLHLREARYNKQTSAGAMMQKSIWYHRDDATNLCFACTSIVDDKFTVLSSRCARYSRATMREATYI